MKDTEWFERIWAHREEVLYPALFGDESEGIFTIPYNMLDGYQLTDPRWATCGVFRFAPTAHRRSWLYVSSGLSNEWFEDQPDATAVSGFGCEFVLESLGREDWPIQRLHQMMCFQIDLCLGRYEHSEPLSIGDRLPLRSPVDFEASELRCLLFTEPTRFPSTLHQESGTAELLQVVGISETERDYGGEAGHEALVDWLQKNTDYPLTVPGRAVRQK